MDIYMVKMPTGEFAAEYVIAHMKGTTISGDGGSRVDIGDVDTYEGYLLFHVDIVGMSEDEGLELAGKVLRDYVDECRMLRSASQPLG